MQAPSRSPNKSFNLERTTMHPNCDPSCVALGTKALVQDVQEPDDVQNGVVVSVQLPHSLLSMVNGLRDSVSTLQTQLSLVQRDLSTLRQNCGGAFTFFPKLPLELRQKVWCFAYRAPQLHILNKRDASCSELSSVFNSCSEARKVGQSLELDYFVFANRSGCPNDNIITRTIRNYVNLDIDTLWLASADCYFDLPTNLVLLCGKCHRGWYMDSHKGNYKSCGESCLSQVDYRTPCKIKRLAINFRDWIKVGVLPDIPQGSLNGLFHLNVDELLFVVGDFEPFARMRDVNFIAPSQGRAEISNAFSQFEKKDRPGFLKTWPEMEEDLQGQMREFKAQVAANKEEFRIELEKEGLEFDGNCFDISLADLSGWVIPKVRFVEVRTTSRKWVVAPAQ